MNQKAFLIICTLFLVIAFYSIYRDVSISHPTKPTFPTQQATLPHIDTNKIWKTSTDQTSTDIISPIYVDLKASSFMSDADDVLVLKTKEALYVYPLWIIGFHQIINDVISQNPIAVTYCPLADTARAFNRALDDITIELATHGDLYNGNLVMYDKKSESSFLQLTGQGFSNTYDGKILNQTTPLERSSWKDVKNQPHLMVLQPVKDVSFYKDFWKKRKSSTEGILSLTKMGTAIDTRLAPFTQGIGVVNDDRVVFVPLSTISYNAKEYLSAQFSTQVYWYVWSGLYPKTVIIE